MRFKLLTVPGLVKDGGVSQRAILDGPNGVDGVIFVADSHRDRFDTNLEALDSLRADLLAQGQDLDLLPFCTQYNKRDLADAVPIDELRSALQPSGSKEGFAAIATSGEGVFDSLKSVIRQALIELRKN